MKTCTLTILYQGSARTLRAEAGENILSILSHFEESIPSDSIDTPCGGRGNCGKCRVRLTGELSAPTEEERKLLGRDLDTGIRLACLTQIEGDATLTLANRGKEVIQTDGMRRTADFTPLPGPYGLAVDIGTTTVACYLCDLHASEKELLVSDKECIAAVTSFMNPQKRFGADILSRIGQILEGKASAADLQSSILEGIRRAIDSLCREAAIPPTDIGSAVITGNTVMQHFFCADDARGMANAPFTPTSLYGNFIDASAVGLPLSPNARVYLPPCFAAYVGGDIASGILAAEVDCSDELTLFIDIGTNGEMGLGNREGICLCATAAGPAFEGAHITHGMAGIEGAIHTVKLDGDRPICEVIGGGSPKGICGSGLIDAVACMLDAELLDETGYLEEDFLLDAQSGIRITPGDIRELQLAKASICAGILTLLAECGKRFDDVSRVVIAGGFGAHIHAHHACRIGLIPPELEDKIVIAGNTAGMGAISLLESEEARERIAALPEKARYLELSGNATFMEHYIEQMLFE